MMNKNRRLNREGIKASKIRLDNWLTKEESTTCNSYNLRDKFSDDGINSINKKLDGILERLEIGEGLIYDDITEAIDELREIDSSRWKENVGPI